FRALRPRALVLVGGCCAGRPGGSLFLWDDLDNSRRLLLGLPLSPQIAVGAADWSPDGRQVVAALFDRASSLDAPARLVLFDPGDPAGRTPVASTEGAQAVVWPRSGILYSRMGADRATELVQLARDLAQAKVIARLTDPLVARLLLVAP